MRSADRAAQFVREALGAGRSREEIAAALRAAGSSEHEIAMGLASWAETPFAPPVPRPQPSLSAREAFLYGLMFVALALTAWHLVSLSFNLVDRWIPDPVEMRRSTFATSQMRWSIASLIVFAPLFLFLNPRVMHGTRLDPGHRRSLVRRWFGYVTLFLASMSLLGDLLWLIYTFLEGEMSARVAAKGASLGVIAGAIFLYFRRELALDGHEG